MIYSLIFLVSLLSGCSFWEKPVDSQDSLNASAPSEASFRPSSTDASQALRKRVWVYPFLNQSGRGGAEISQFAGEQVAAKLSNLQELIVVKPDEIVLPRLLQNLFEDPPLEALVELARSHGVVAVILGNIKDIQIKERGSQVGLFRTKYNTVTATVEVKLLDVLTQKMTQMDDFSAEVTEENTQFFGSRSLASNDAYRSEEAIAQAIEKMAPLFSQEARRIGWSGRIAKIDVHRYYINAGEKSGVTKNQLLRVFGDPEQIIDKESGLALGIAPGRFKGLLKVVDFFGEDGAIAIIHSGAGFREKDRVETYTPPAP